MSVTASSSKDTTAVSVNIKEEKTNKDQEEANDNEEVRKTFVLPPEYDKNDSRWTLKYREPAPELVELIPHSGVYINVDKLAECQRMSNACNKLARLLLTEIFTTSALSTCSWSGAAANDFDFDGGQARPGLDEHARDILLKFVEEYGLLQGWIITDYQCILNHMREIMLEMKGVRQKEKDDDELLKKGSHSRVHQTMLEVSYDAQKIERDDEYEFNFDRILEESSHLHQIMLEMRHVRLTESDDDDDVNILEEGSYTRLNQNMLKMTCDTQKDAEDVYDKVLNKDSHTCLNLTVVKMTREGEPQKEAQILYDEVFRNASHTCKLVLPPDYDENDSRWTLKYREPAPGLVELMENSSVYVNADKLVECKKLSNDCLTLVRMLLSEVFTVSALSTCSWAGAKPNADCVGGFLRPGLDEHARKILLQYVVDYGEVQYGTKPEVHLILSCIHHKMSMMRNRT